MSRRSSARSHHRAGPGPAADGRPDRAAERRSGAGYTLAHAGRQLRLGPIAFWVVVGTLVIMAVWSITTATYFAFREDVLTRLIARQADLQFGYEDRIAELRAQIDRISSRQLIDQEQYEQKLDQILRRQTMLEGRASALHGLGEPTGSAKPPARAGAGGEPRVSPLKSSFAGDKGAFLLPLDRRAPVDPSTSMFAASAGGIGGAIVRLQGSLDRVEQRQMATLNSMAENYDAKARRMRGVLAELGVDVGKAAVADGAPAMGGPFIPAALPKDAMAFERQIHRIRMARAQVTGSPAMHTGLDLQGDAGDAVRATASGTVTHAGWSGGYGRVVDIDHGNGLSTRYAHLSSIDVRVGQAVRSGQIVGKIGSTGRSTGPHLHYETRMRGAAVDPQKFLRAGQRLDGSL
jgi:murein DD-endopeptidase MepM/ murein hydrolase activator NlpD